MVSSESFSAHEVLADLALSVGLDATYEVVPPPGLVHLNRTNLIVMAGPRLLPFLEQVMEADPHLSYARDDHGWYLADKTTGSEYRSPIDDGDATDYAYIGRLPRLDGKGTFLYLAGIHAPGNLGAARFIADNITELHRELKTRVRFRPKGPQEDTQHKGPDPDLPAGKLLECKSPQHPNLALQTRLTRTG